MYKKKMFFINNSVEAVIPFKEEYQGLLKLHLSLRGVSSSVGKNRAIFKRRNLLSSRKIMYEEAFQNLLKSCLYFVGDLNGSNEETMARQQKKEVL